MPLIINSRDKRINSRDLGASEGKREREREGVRGCERVRARD